MPRLRNKVTGAVVSVSDSTAARLDGNWGPADEAKPEPKRPARVQKNDTSE